MRWILLPGLDGTGRLFERLLEVVPTNVTPIVIRYPGDQVIEYKQLCGFIEQKLRNSEPHILIAESFSGPLAISLAFKGSHNLKATVLCATFVYRPISPVKTVLAKIGRNFIFNCRPPEWAVKHYLLGRDASEQMVRQFYTAMSLVKPEVLSKRVMMALDADVRNEFLQISTPTLWISAAKDKLIDRYRSECVIAGKKNVSIKYIDSPHSVLQRRPAEVVQLINEFIKEVVKESGRY